MLHTLIALYNLYKRAYTPWEWTKELKDYANNLGMDLFSSPFDVTAVDWLNFGVAVSHNDLDTTDYNTWTADATFSAGGFDFTGAYVATIDDTNGDDWGTVWTASYDVTDKAQLFGQYEIGHLEGVETDLKIATFGVNYTFNDNVKWTTDVGYAFDSVDAGWDLGNSGWNTTANEGETLIRTQLTVRF